VLLWRPLEVAPGQPPSIAVASAEVSRLPCIGIRAVIAPGFDARFVSEAVRQGILPVALPGETIDAIGARLEASPREMITVDLECQTVDVPGLGSFSFDTPPWVRRKLLQGLDDFDELLEHQEVAAAFRIEDRNRRPWLYASGQEEQEDDPSDG
jgi:3-isopropylmalate/(R)-2-methylmalate dehydratase small subunit